MDNPGILNLGDRSIAAALTGETITEGVSQSGVAQAFVDRLAGMLAATVQVAFAYGSGGTTCKVDIETSLDQGATWIPIARLAFTTASATKLVNLSGLTAKTSPATVAALSDDASLDGVLGDRLRARVTSTGTYTDTTVSVRVAAR